MDSTPQWYIAQDGQPTGPLSAEDLLARAREGLLQPHQLIWHPDFGSEWRPARTVEALAAAFPVTVQARVGTAGTTPNREITRRAREALAGHWAEMFGIFLLWLVINLAVQGLGVGLDMYAAPLGTIASLILAVPFAIGLLRVQLAVADGQPPRVNLLFSGFPRWGVGLMAQILVQIFFLLWVVAFTFLTALIGAAVVAMRGGRFDSPPPMEGPMRVLTVLLVVGWVVAMTVVMLRYMLTFWIIADDPDAGPAMAIRRSVQLMRGRKWKFVCFALRFLGWALLAMLTCGVGFLFLAPYMGVATALWYRDTLPPET